MECYKVWPQLRRTLFCQLRCNARCDLPHNYPLVVNFWARSCLLQRAFRPPASRCDSREGTPPADPVASGGSPDLRRQGEVLGARGRQVRLEGAVHGQGVRATRNTRLHECLRYRSMRHETFRRESCRLLFGRKFPVVALRRSPLRCSAHAPMRVTRVHRTHELCCTGRMPRPGLPDQ